MSAAGQGQALLAASVLAVAFLQPCALSAAEAPRSATRRDAICEHVATAIRHRHETLDRTVEVTCVHVPGTPSPGLVTNWELVAGADPLRAGPASVRLRARSALTNGAEVAVLVHLAVRSRLWVTKVPVAAGASIDTSWLSLDWYRWPDGARISPASAEAPTGRARRALLAGQAVTSEVVVGETSVARGDRLSIEVRSAGLTLRANGRALSDASPGQQVRIQVESGTVVLVGRVVPGPLVLVEE